MPRQPPPPDVTPADFDQTLRAASVQAIQLELIRRTCFNAMRGDRVVESLFRHRGLWEAALLDRPGFCDYEHPRRLLSMSLIKLRDLPGNYWNADTLYLLAKDPETARELARVIQEEDWAGEVQVHDDPAEIGMALGESRGDFAPARALVPRLSSPWSDRSQHRREGL